MLSLRLTAYDPDCVARPGPDSDIGGFKRLQDGPGTPLTDTNGRAAATEWIENDAVAPAAVANQIGYERDRLYRRMQRKITLAGGMETIDTRIVENICASYMPGIRGRCASKP